MSDLRMKVEKLPGGSDFIDSVEGKSVEQLEERLVLLAKDLEQSERAKEKDLEDLSNPRSLGSLKYAISIAEGPYKDLKKAVNLKTRFIMKAIEEKGGSIDTTGAASSDEE
jgi:hypothetical protein